MKYRNISFTILASLLIIASLTPEIGFTQGFTYQPLSGITDPQGNALLDATTTLPFTLTRLYQFGIGLVFTLGFLMFLYAGWEYIGSDLITKKEDGRKRMTHAVIGIIIALTGYVLLNTINPDILKFQSLDLDLEDPQETAFLTNLFRDKSMSPAKKIGEIKTTDTGIGVLVTEKPSDIPGIEKNDIIKSIKPAGFIGEEILIKTSEQLQKELSYTDRGSYDTNNVGLSDNPRTIDSEGNTIIETKIKVQRAGNEQEILVKIKVAEPITLEDLTKKLKLRENPNGSEILGTAGLTFTDGYSGLVRKPSDGTNEPRIRGLKDSAFSNTDYEFLADETKIRTTEDFTKGVEEYLKQCTPKINSKQQRYCIVPFDTGLFPSPVAVLKPQ